MRSGTCKMVKGPCEHRPRLPFSIFNLSAGPLVWAAFLGCSWTWCIGMFLPVLLVRDYGVWGWVVFAVPNVLGAAAMGWVLSDPARSSQLVERHRAACVCFSLITIVFHVFFVRWLVGRMLGDQRADLTFVIAPPARAFRS